MPVATDCTALLSPLDPTFIRDPYPTYRRLRMTGSVLWHETLQSWVVTGHGPCAGVLRDQVKFPCDARAAGLEPHHAPMIQVLDGAAHRELRAVVMAIIGRRSAALDPLAVANQRIDMLAGRGRFCLIDEYALPFALDCLNATFDVPKGMSPELCRLMKVVVRSMSSKLFPDAVAAGEAARAELNNLVRSLAGTFPEIDGTARRLGGQSADDAGETLYGSIRVALLASINSVSRALGLAALHISALLPACRTDVVRRLSPIGSSQSRAAVEELVRYDSPVQAVERFVSRTVPLGGVDIERGQRLTLLLGCANRDPSVFPAPDRLDVRRAPNPHLGWGSGAHACVGSRIAARQLAAALVALFSAGDVVPQSSPTFHENPALRGLDSYIVRLVRPSTRSRRSPA